MSTHEVDMPPIALSDWHTSLIDPTSFYLRCKQVFHESLPERLRMHRRWFSDAEQRGFGEGAFHVMWWHLFWHFRFKGFLEIGVYRGQVISLATCMQSMFRVRGNVVGITPLSSLGNWIPSPDFGRRAFS